MLALALQEPAALAATDRSSVERVTIGSAPLTQALIDRSEGRVPRRAGDERLGHHRVGARRLRSPSARGAAAGLSLGHPVEDVDVRLVAGDDLDAEEGVLQMRTPAVMPGYLNLPEKTAQVMTKDGYYITGDVMRRDADGFYYFVGRADDMFVCGGENIYPGEVETMLERHPGIQQAVRGVRARRDQGRQAGGLRGARERQRPQRRRGQAVGAGACAGLSASPPRGVRRASCRWPAQARSTAGA